MYYKKTNIALSIFIVGIIIVFTVSYVSSEIQKDMYPDGSGTWRSIAANTPTPPSATAAASVSKWTATSSLGGPAGTIVATWTRVMCRTLSDGTSPKGRFSLYSSEGEIEIMGELVKIQSMGDKFTGGCLKFLSGQGNRVWQSIEEAPGRAQASITLDPAHSDGNAETDDIIWGEVE